MKELNEINSYERKILNLPVSSGEQLLFTAAKQQMEER